MTTLGRAIELVKTALDDSTVEHFIGRKFLARGEQVRRIVWVPIASRIERHARGGGAPYGVQRVTFCCNRLDSVVAHIFAEDEDAVDCLLTALLSAYYRACPEPIDPGPFSWVTEEEGKASETGRQPLIVCPFAFKSYVASEKAALTTIQAESHTCSIVTEIT